MRQVHILNSMLTAQEPGSPQLHVRIEIDTGTGLELGIYNILNKTLKDIYKAHIALVLALQGSN